MKERGVAYEPCTLPVRLIGGAPAAGGEAPAGAAPGGTAGEDVHEGRAPRGDHPAARASGAAAPVLRSRVQARLGHTMATIDEGAAATAPALWHGL